MSNLTTEFIGLPIAAGDGAGASVNIKQFVSGYTLFSSGTFLGEVITVQGSIDGVSWNDIANFNDLDMVIPYVQTFQFIRTFRDNFQGSAPVIRFSGVRDLTWLNLIRAGQSYVAEIFALPLVGNFGETQLFNPVGSGVRLLLRSASVKNPGIANVNLRVSTVPLAFLGPNLPAFITVNLLRDGLSPAAVGEVRYDRLPAVLADAFNLLLAPVSTPRAYPNSDIWGMELLPGFAMNMRSTPANATLITIYEWAEEPLVQP